MSRFLGTSDLDWGSWAYGLLAAFIGGGSSAVVSGVVVAVNDPQHYNFANRKFYYLVLSVFAASGTLNFFAYLKQNPLPVVKTTKTVEVTEKTKHPDTTVVTTTKTEKIEPAPEPKPHVKKD